MSDEPRLTPAAVVALAKGDLENFFVAATPGGIEAQERAGSDSICENTRLPRMLQGFPGGDSRATLESLGITVEETDDDLFYQATLPEGWSMQRTSHGMHSKVVDEKGRERLSVFYKAAFYDRRADVYPKNRYSITVRHSRYAPDPESEYVSPRETGMVQCWLLDGGKEVHLIAEQENAEDSYATHDALRDIGLAYMQNNYPEWQDHTAYWD